MSDKMKIDVSIAKDKEAAEEYNRLYEETYNNPMKIIELHTGKKVNLFGFKDKVLKALEGIEPELIDEVMKIREGIHENLRKMATLKRKAFGLSHPNNRSEDVPRNMMELVKSEVLEWFGQLYSEAEIQKKLVDKGIPVNIALLQKFRQQNKVEIEKLQHAYEMDWRSVSVARKRSRLDQLSYIYNVLKNEFDDSKGDKQLPYSREMRAVLEQVRKEVEGNQIKLTVDGKIDISGTIEVNKSVEELYSSINFMSLLIGRVSARFNINPTVLHYQLMNSWYSEFTGVKRNGQMKELTPQYPSSIVYNWDNIKEKHEGKVALYERMNNESQFEEAKIVEEFKEDKVNLRKLMLEKLKELDNSKENL